MATNLLPTCYKLATNLQRTFVSSRKSVAHKNVFEKCVLL